MVDKYEFINKPKDGILCLLEHDDANRSVLQTREAGMKIYERKGISGSIQFSGVFQALGEGLNEYLRALENPEHDLWSEDRAPAGQKTKARELLRDLYRWYKEAVHNQYDIEIEEVVDAFGVADLLPLEKNDSSDEMEKAGIINAFSSFEIKEKKYDSPVVDGDKADDMVERIADISEGVGKTGGFGYEERYKGQGSGGGAQPMVTSGENCGERGQIDDGEQKVTKYTEYSVGDNDLVAFKIVEVDFTYGHYRLLLQPKKTMKLGYVDLQIIGDNGHVYAAVINKIESDTALVELKYGNRITFKSIKKNKPLVVDFYINENYRIKMRGDIYEVRT